MTGSTVKRLRSKLGLDPFAFAQMLGVHVSTIYRWEDAESAKIDPLQREVLTALYDLKISTEEGSVLGKQVRDGMIARGTLGGLAVLLNYITKDQPHA